MKAPIYRAACGLILLSIAGALAQTNFPQTISSVLASGGGTASGGGHTITHTLGESIVGSSSGGDYSLAAGFMAMETVMIGVDLNLTAIPASVVATENLVRSLSLNVTNSGSATASNVQFAVAMPAGLRITAVSSSAGTAQFTSSNATCTVATLASTASFAVTLTLRPNFLPENSPLSVNLSNISAIITCAEDDSDSANNSVAVPVIVAAQTDWGDARGGFPVTVEENGPHHRYSPTAPWLGARWDNDGNGNHTPLADYDDTHGGTDDDDGLDFSSPIVAGAGATVIVTCANTPGFLDAWADFNNDSDWDDAGEHIAAGKSLVLGANPVSITVPADAVAGSITTRWRVSTTGGLAHTGYGGTGEVEDHLMLVRAAPRPSLKVVPGAATLTFVSENGVNYVVEYADSLPAESWTLLMRVAGNGNSVAVTDDTIRPMRFYRVRVE